nr:urea ABC transporter permease [Halomicroarcula sp. SYNS111]
MSLNLGSTLGITVAIPVAVAVATVVAFVLGYFMFYGRVTGVFVAIITLVTTVVMQTFMAQTAGSEWAIGDVKLGGFNGMPGIPNVALGVEGVSISFRGMTFYWLVLVLLVVTYLGARALVNGRFGYAMVGVREDEDRIEMLGYDVRRVKLTVFTLGGAISGLSGVLYASWGNYIDPSVFTLTFATLPVIWVTVGGRESLLGAVLATVALEWFRQQLSITGSEFALVVVGLLLLFIVLVVPDGIVPYVHEKGLGAYRKYTGTDDDRPAGTPQEEIAE